MTSGDFSNQAQTILDTAEKQGIAPITTWSNSLKRKSLGEALQELEAFTRALVAREKNPDKLLEIIEAIRPNIHQLNPSDIVNLATAGENRLSASQADTLLYLQVLALESAVYEQIIQLTDQVSPNILALAVHRNIAALINRQIIYYQNYLPIPEKEWLRIHRLFYVAIERKITGFSTPDKIYFLGKTLSIVNLYIMSLLLGCGRMNHLTPPEITRVQKSLPDWCTLVRISRKPCENSENQLVVDITSGSAPHFAKLFTAGHATISCYLQVDALVEKLDKLLEEEEKRDADPKRKAVSVPVFGVESQPLRADMIRHLKSAWSEYIYREARVATDENIRVCTGFNNIFFYLSGACKLDSFIGSKVSLSIVYDKHEDITTIEKQRSGDVWSAFLTAPEGTLVSGDVPPEFNFQHFFPVQDPQAVHPEYPVRTIRMKDTSSRGCRLHWTEEAETPLEVGELIGLCRSDSQGHWHIGEIAWKETSATGEISTGIKLLSTRAIPVAVDVPLRLGNHENFVGGIIIPAEEHLHTREALFVIAPLNLNQREYIAISQKGIEEKIHLNKLSKLTSFIEIHECSFVVQPPPVVVPRKV